VKPADQFHIGIVVDDVASTRSTLSHVFGYEWGEEMGGPISVTLPDGDVVIDLVCMYSMSSPRLELVRAVPGTLWQPAAGSGVHHIGYWSDDVAEDAAALERHGFGREAAGQGPDGNPYWTYHRGATGPRVELVSRMLQPVMEQYFATGKPTY